MKQPKNYSLALDQGTLSSRAVVYDESGNVLSSTSQSITLQRIDRQQVEQDAEQILNAMTGVLQAVLSDQQSCHERIACAGLATQRSSILAWRPSTGKALSPVLSWQDTRAADWLSGFASSAEWVQSRTGLRLSAHYSVSKMQWLLQNNQKVRQALQQQDCVITPIASYLLYHLSDNPSINIDIANASRTLLCNIRQHDWDPQLLELFSIPAQLMASCQPTNHHYGAIKNTAINITAVNGDQTAALYSNGEPDNQALRVNLGTGAFVLTPVSKGLLDTAEFSRSGLLAGISCSHQQGARYYIEGTVNGAGSAMQWLEQSDPEINFTELLQGELSSTNQRAVFINAIGNMGSPIWRSDIRAHFIDCPSIRQAPRQAVIAVLESIVFLLVINIRKMRQLKTGIEKIEISGGLSNLDFVCQALSSLSELRVERSQDTEATARGIAWLANDETQSWKTGQIEKSWQALADDALKQRFQQFTRYLQQHYGLEV